VVVERQREAARKKGTALRAEDLDEYRKLLVWFRTLRRDLTDVDDLTSLRRKASASTQAVDERKELEARKRELKKLTDALNTAKENLAATQSQQSKLQDEVSIVQERQSSVRPEVEM
jgi:chromosome segregation ATPase